MEREEVSFENVLIISCIALTIILVIAGIGYTIINRPDTIIGPPPSIHLQVGDASTSSDYLSNNNSTIFEPGEPLLKLEQTRGDPIEWGQMVILISLVDDDERYECGIYCINGVAFNDGDNSEVGDVILIDCLDSWSEFRPNDQVLLIIVKEDYIIFKTNQPVRLQ